jgi:hypothetical protein
MAYNGGCSMNKVQELEQQLKQAKEDEKLQQKQKDLKAIQDQYQGKAFGSREFERAAKAATDDAIYFEKFYLEEEKVKAFIWTVRRSRQGKDYKFSQDQYDYHRGKGEQVLTSDYKNEFAAVHDMLYFRKKEIPVEKFMQLYKAAEAMEEEVTKAFSSTVAADYSDLIRQGDSTKEDRIEKAIKDLGLDLIDMTQYPKVWKDIQYSDLPLFHHQKWLPRDKAKAILNYQVSLWRKELNDGWNNARAIEWLHQRINTLTTFINDHL